MPAAARKGDQCTGHGSFFPRANDEGSPNVFINGKAAHRQGDHWVHHDDRDTSHDSTLSEGSGTVFINGKQAGRIGDSVACGSVIAQGSDNVFIGG